MTVGSQADILSVRRAIRSSPKGRFVAILHESASGYDSGSSGDKEESSTMQDYETQLEKPLESLPPSDSAAAASAQRSALLIVFLVMFIDLLGFGIVLPLLPRYGQVFVKPLFPEPSAEIQGAILGLLMASFSAMQFLFAPIWGRISDRKGRRPFLILGLVGSVLFYALFGFASDWGREPGRQALGLALLFLARIGAGIAGSTVTIAAAVIADVTTPERRRHGMALIGAAFGLAFFFGPALAAGILALMPDLYGGPGYLASGLSLLALVLAMVLMPETLKADAPPRYRGGMNFGGLRLAWRTPTVVALILISFLATLAFANFEPTLALLTQDVLGYGDLGNSVVFCFVGFVLLMAQGGLYQVLARRGVGEIPFMLVGAVLMALGLGGLGIITRMVMSQAPAASSGLLASILAALAVAVTGFAFLTPSVQALVSRRSDPTRQGEILGVNQSANALSRILGPIFGLSLYELLPAHYLPYLFADVLLIVAVLLTLQARQAKG
jgi:DHA1 family tetracycline resistance protein-like MFS transporter